MHVLHNKSITATFHEFILLGFLCSQEIEILLFVLFSIIYILTLLGNSAIICAVWWEGPETPHSHVYFIGQLLIPGDLLHQFQCAQHAVQLPIQDQDHLLSWLYPTVLHLPLSLCHRTLLPGPHGI